MNNEFGKRLKKIREERNMSQDELASLLKTSKQVISRYETSQRIPKITTVYEYAQKLGVSLEELTGYAVTDGQAKLEDNILTDNRKNTETVIRIPVLGTVKAGIPMEAIEEILDWEEISEKMSRQGEFFGLRIKGDSMSPRILDGDVVIVRQQPDAETGDIVIVKINGDDACCKKLIKHSNSISLISFNPAYEPMYFNHDDVISKPVTIIGKVVELRAKF